MAKHGAKGQRSPNHVQTRLYGLDALVEAHVAHDPSGGLSAICRNNNVTRRITIMRYGLFDEQGQAGLDNR